MRTIVVGAGIAGLASAIRMALRGHQVDVFEANSHVGGKLGQLDSNGYRFDTGPSLFTMPHYFEELFQLAGRNFSDYCPFQKLDVITHYFYPNGKSLKAYRNPVDFANEVEDKLGIPAMKTRQHLNKSAKVYELTENIFLKKSLHTVKQQSAGELLKATRHFRSLDLFRTMHKANAARFNNQKDIVQLFDRFATYNGSDPYQAPATLNVIPHLEHNIGAYFPERGMYSIVQAMFKLANELGIRFHLGCPVESINVEKERATGITTGGRQINADNVICNVDIMFAYRKLLKGQKSPERILKQPRSSSALIFYWGIKKEHPALGLHNILFSKDYKAEFQALFQKKNISHDPTVYINITSKYNPNDAPSGSENWFVMINVPNNDGQQWDKMIPVARRAIINKINEMLETDIEALIETEHQLDPRTIESGTGSYKGALYGSSSNNRMAAFMRHPNISKKIKGLYFCGGSVHPGGGIPLCMLSASIVDELMHS